MDSFLKINEKKLLLLIFLAAFLFRFFMLSQNPVNLSMDEVSIGYSAYSVLKTGRDEWGVRFPLAFESVGDFKPPVNIYLTVVSIAVIGLNEFSVRFPVALLGSITPLIFVLLLKNMKFSRFGYIFAGFWFALLPWHVHFSRGSFEAVTALFFMLLGALCFILCIRKKSFLLFNLSNLFLALSLWSYHAERLFIPALIIALFVIFRKDILFIFSNTKKFFASVLLVTILITPFIYLTFFTQAVKVRALSTSIFREQSLIQELHNGKYRDLGDKIFDNDIYIVSRHWAGKYLNYFDPRFWFWKGMQFTPPQYFDSGLFYAADIILILPGIYFLFTEKDKVKKYLGMFWFFAGPVPASLAMNEQHPLRALTWIPFFGLAVASTLDRVGPKLPKRLPLVLIYMATLVVGIVYFSDIYFRQFPRFFADAWQYGYKDIALTVCKEKNNYDKVIVTDTFGEEAPVNTGIPGMYVLFYCKVDPNDFRLKGAPFDKIKIRRIQWKSDKIITNSLIVGSALDLPRDQIPEKNILKTIYYPDGKPAFVFLNTKGLQLEKGRMGPFED